MATSVIAGVQQITVTVDNPNRDDLGGLRIWSSTVNGFVPGPTNIVYDGPDLTVVMTNQLEGETRYLRMALYSVIDPGDYVLSAQFAVTPLPPTANASNITSGTLRGSNVFAGSLGTKGSTLTISIAAGVTSLPVENTDVFPAAGTVVIFSPTAARDYDVVTYTGKTATTLTGCSGVLAHTGGEIVIPLTKTMVIDNNTNEMRFYGDRGDGTIERMAAIGITANGGDFEIGTFGSLNSTRTAIRASGKGSGIPVIVAESSAGTSGAAYALLAKNSNPNAAAVRAENNGAGFALDAYSANGPAIYAQSDALNHGALKVKASPAPTGGALGEVYFDTDGRLGAHDGTVWKKFLRDMDTTQGLGFGSGVPDADWKLVVDQTNTALNGGGVRLTNYVANLNSQAFMFRKARGTIGAPATVSTGDYLGVISAYGYGATDFYEAARIQFQSDGVAGTGDMPGRIVFLTSSDGSSTPTEVLRLSANNFATFAGGASFGASISSSGGATFDGNIISPGTASLGAMQVLGTAGTADARALIARRASTGGITLRGYEPTDAYVDLDPMPGDGASNATIRLFRVTTTTGPANVDLFRGDGTSAVQSRLRGAGSSFLNALAGNVSIGKSTDDGINRLQVAGSMQADAAVEAGFHLRNRGGYFEIYPYNAASYGTDGMLQSYYDSINKNWRLYARDAANNVVASFSVKITGGVEASTSVSATSSVVAGSVDPWPVVQGRNTNFASHSSGAAAGYSATRWSNDAIGPNIYMMKSRGGIGTPTIVANNDEVGSLMWAAADGTDLVTQAGRIAVFIDGTPAANQTPGRMVFYTGNPAGGIGEVLRLNSDNSAVFSGLVTAALFSNLLTTGPIGYDTGAGGSVTQLTSKSTSVTLNALCGRINVAASFLNEGVQETFTLNNSFITAADVVIVHRASGGTDNCYTVVVDSITTGSCRIKIKNSSTVGRTEALALNFAVIQGVTA